MNSCQHVALDWFSAIGPTVATLAAVGATIWATLVARQVSRNGAALQRRISGPRLTILERARPIPQSLEWIVEFRNDGQTAANIDALRILVNGSPYEGRPFEDPNAFWLSVLQGLGLMRCGSLAGYRIRTPLALAPNATQLLFQVVISDPMSHAQQCIQRLRLEVDYTSLWGEKFSTAEDLGRF